MLIAPVPATAREAWRAFNAMEATKRRHLALLQGLEEKYQKFGSANAEEQAWLERLLDDHDQEVAHFALTMRELKERDPKAHAALLDYLASVNQIVEAYANHRVPAETR